MVSFRIRGTLGSMSKLVRVTGCLIAFIVATYVDYSKIAFIFMGVPVLFFIIFLWLPNTPAYLMRVGEHEVRNLRFQLSTNHIYLIIKSKFISFSVSFTVGSKKVDSVLQRT